MERIANNLDDAQKLFGESDEPVICNKDVEGSPETITALTLQQAEDFYAA